MRHVGPQTAPPCSPPAVAALAASDRSRFGSLAPAGTCARYSGCLAAASLLGSGRRCRLARAAFALASSLDFLQGTSEKIHLQRLLPHQLAQAPHLLAQLPSRRR